MRPGLLFKHNFFVGGLIRLAVKTLSGSVIMNLHASESTWTCHKQGGRASGQISESTISYPIRHTPHE